MEWERISSILGASDKSFCTAIIKITINYLIDNAVNDKEKQFSLKYKIVYSRKIYIWKLFLKTKINITGGIIWKNVSRM